MKLEGPIFLMQPIPYFGERLKGTWLVEPKIDGWRLQIIKYKDGHVEFWGRRLEKKPNWTESLKYLNRSLKFLPEGTLLDCELYSDKGRRGIPSVIKRTNKASPLIFVFDVVYYKNKYIGKLPLKERKMILKTFRWKEPFFLLEHKRLKNLEESLKEASEKEFEGVVIKEVNSPYLISKDGPIATHYWRKVKY